MKNPMFGTAKEAARAAFAGKTKDLQKLAELAGDYVDSMPGMFEVPMTLFVLKSDEKIPLVVADFNAITVVAHGVSLTLQPTVLAIRDLKKAGYEKNQVLTSILQKKDKALVLVVMGDTETCVFPLNYLRN